MNRRIALFLAVAAVVILASGCNRPMSTGPLPKPQGQTSVVGMPTQVIATAAAVGATLAPGAPQPTSPAGGVPAATSAPAPAATSAPVPEATSAPEPAPTAAPPAAPVAPGVPINYTVMHGDWVYNIARKFNVSPNAIVEANNLYPPYSLHAGQILIIPAGGTPPGGGGNVYVVQPGDTLYSIARKYGKSVAAIADANHLVNIHFIFVGQRLVIP
jgi:LysM repeat protein